jgi:transcriptional regulator with XRE-family HTH domain
MNNNIVDEIELFNIIGKNVKYYRKLYSLNNNDMTQESLAEKIEVSTSLIGNLESKKTHQGISIYNLYKISKILDIPIDKFFVR